MIDLLEQHAMEAAYLWELRESAAREPHYDLDDLARLDARVEANVDGLRLAGDAGWEACKGLLGEKELGEVFAASVVAIDRKDAKGLAHVLDLAGESHALLRGIEGGFAWPHWAPIETFVRALLDPRCPPPLQRLGLVACVAHGCDPGDALANGVHATDKALAARALLAAGELGRGKVVRERMDALGSSDLESRFGAAWSLAREGDADGIEALAREAASGGPRASDAAELALRRLDASRAHALVQEIARRSPRAGVQAARASGLPELVPWLLDCAAVPELARVAGQALAALLGIDLVHAKMRAKKPEGFEPQPNDDPDDPRTARDPDENLPWPDVAKLRALWGRARSRFAEGVRHLDGKPVGEDAARDALERGAQPLRAAAALELALLFPDRPLFDVRAPAHHQRRRLGGGA